MLTLRSSALTVRVDPKHGAEVLDVVDRDRDCQLLGRPAFEPAPPLPGELDEDTWTAAYRGGWQLATPNAGASCELGGVRHGFHGRASNDPWAVTFESPSAARLQWQGHGLLIERELAVTERRIAATTTWSAVDGRVPFLAVEHLSLGRVLLDPELRLELPGGRAWVSDEQSGPVEAPPNAPEWPRVADSARPELVGSRWALADAGAEYIMISGLPRGWARASNPASGAALTLTWDAQLMPHVWLWREARASAGIWGRRSDIVGLEPASIPHGLGLARAVEAGQAIWAEPGAPRTSRVTLTVEPFAA